MTNKKYLLISALFLIVSAAAICMSVVLSTTVNINDGEWTGVAEGRNGPIELVLTVQDEKSLVCGLFLKTKLRSQKTQKAILSSRL